jgi:hypothetical protein
MYCKQEVNFQEDWGLDTLQFLVNWSLMQAAAVVKCTAVLALGDGFVQWVAEIFCAGGKKPQTGCEERPESATGSWQVSLYV